MIILNVLMIGVSLTVAAYTASNGHPFACAFNVGAALLNVVIVARWFRRTIVRRRYRMTAQQFVNVAANLALCFYPKAGEVNPYAVFRVLVAFDIDVDPDGPRLFTALTKGGAENRYGS